MKTIKISDETYELIKDQLNKSEGKEINNFSDMVGEKYFFRTVSYFALGTIKRQVGSFFELENACWVADTGQFTDFIKKGEIDELEITGRHFVNIEMVVDFFPWAHNLPKDRK